MTTFRPADEQFEARVRASFAKQKAMETMGARLASVEPGAVEIRMPYSEALTQQHGFLHAGIVGAIADSACGYAAYSLMPPDAGILSIEFKLNLLAPAAGEEFAARARVKRAGRTITVCEADVFAIRGGEEKLVATMLGTMMTIVDRPGVTG